MSKIPEPTATSVRGDHSPGIEELRLRFELIQFLHDRYEWQTAEEFHSLYVRCLNLLEKGVEAPPNRSDGGNSPAEATKTGEPNNRPGNKV